MFYYAQPAYCYQAPPRIPVPSPEAQELNQLKTFLMTNAKSPATTMILSTADTREMRGIKKTMKDLPLNPTLMEWATVIFGEAINHPVAPTPRTVHQWRNSLLFVHERLKSIHAEHPHESWLVLNAPAVLPTIVNDFRRIVEEAVRFQSRTQLRFSFNGMACFASHYTKHAVCLRLTVSEYLQKAVDLFRQTPFTENGCQVHRKHGWTVYITHTREGSYISTLHLKASYHAQYLKHM